MSEEDFIYSAITDDNVNAFDLSVIASTLASTDKLVRQNKQQQEENERLREKISSLRESAMQIKSLYEAELAKTGRIEAQLATYVSQCQELEQRCAEAENERVNTDLVLKERIAEYDRQIETNEARYRGIICDLVRYHATDQKSDTGHSAVKWKDLKVHAGTAEKLDLPEEVKAFFHRSHPPGHASWRSKRKKRPEMCDQESQTIENRSAPRMRNSRTNTDEPYPVQRVDPPVEKKKFCDKGTMHRTMSTITRSTCTSAFIKRVDVGVNFPEVLHKSVDEILRECTRLPPLLLSPIMEMEPRPQIASSRQSVETQTDCSQSPELGSPNLVVMAEKPQLVTCGTMTSLKNIRKRIDYRKAEGAGGAGVGIASFQQQYISIAEQLYAKKIKKEEQMASPPVGPFGSDDTFGRMHPHLSTIWTLLGETIFSLMGSPGRRFDGQCYSMINEQLATIRDMIEADGRRESELMSAMFSNVSATVEAAAGYGKGRSSGFPMRLPRVPPEQDRPPSSQPPATFLPSSDDCRAPAESFVQVQRPIERDQFQGEKERFPAVQNDTVIPSSLPPSPPFSLSCPAQTKETEEVAVVTSTTTSTISSPLVEQPVNNDVQIENETEANVARSKDTVDGIGAIPSDSTAVVVLDQTESATSSANIINSESVLMDEENDRIAQELRLMEEGEGGDSPIAPAPGGFSGDSENPGLASIEDILAGPKPASPATGRVPKGLTVERKDIGPRLLAENCTPPDQRPSTPPNQLEPSSTGTFVSPIKVKETNDLVKDQFKTPTQPPISKRKLRIRRSGDSPPDFSPKRQRLSETYVPPPVDQAENAGRLSPTTEFLLEDDWDQKFSSIKAALFGHAIEGTCRPLSPIADRIESDEGEVEVDEEPQRSLPLQEISAIEQKEAEGVASAERQDGCPLVDKDPFEIVPAIDRKENSEIKGGPGENESRVKKIDKLAMEVDSVPEESHRPVGSTASENALVIECSADPDATVASESRVQETVTPQEMGSSDSKQEEKEAKEPINKLVEAERTPCVEKPVVDVKEDGEIVDNGEKEQENAKASEAVVVVAVDHLESPESPGGWDSPMSPPAHETGASITTSESVYILDSPLSPPPASPCDITSCAPPKLIPLEHVNLHRYQQRTRGPIDLAIECYKLERRFEVVNTHVGRLNAQEQRSMQQLAQALQRYVKSPWTDASLAEALLQVLAISQDGRVIARAVLQTVVSHGDIVINLENTPPAPPIPVTQQKLVLLVRHLAPRLTSEPFDRVIMRELDRRVFQLKSEASVPLPGLIALTFLYIGLEDSKPPTLKPWHRTYSVRLYLFKCLYYFGFKCLPLVYYVLRAFPFALPKKGSPNYDNADAMINTIRTILMNINYSEGGITGGSESGLYKKRELFALLTYNYGYQPGSPTYEELVVNLVEKIRANRLRNVPHALVLVAKRKSYDWARQHIIQKRLYPLLNDYLKLLDLMSSGAPGGGGGSLMTSMPSTSGCDGAGLDERIVACIYTISSIMKTHPANEDVSGVMQIFTTIVQLARGNQAIQEEAIAGLVKFSRFGHADIFERISHWQPTYPVSDRIKLMLATLVHRKDLRFWQQLIQNKIVDIDDRLLKQCRNSVKPLLVDYVAPSPNPLTVEVWRGDISASHECLEGTDAVIGIEIIEHLHQSVLDKVPENVFGFIRPKVAFFSTPNAEYNVLFDGLLANGFRHDDHKFEWTRAQFEEWASSICQRYPDYCVKYFGIGPAPPGSEAIGCVSQMAVFVRKDFLSGLPDPPTKTPPSSVVDVRTDEPQQGESSKTKYWFDRETREVMAVLPPQDASAGKEEEEEEEDLVEAFSRGGDMDEGWTLEKELNLDIDNGSSDDEQEEDDGDLVDIPIPEEMVRAMRVRNDSGNFEEDEEAELRNGEYWLIVREEYPVAPPDERTAGQRVRDEALYQLRRLRNFGEDFFNPEQQAYLIPLHAVHNCLGTEQATMEQVRTIVTEEGYRITAEDMICVPMEYSSDEDAVDDFAEYDVDERFVGFEEDGINECPNRAVEGLSLAEDNATWD